MSEQAEYDFGEVKVKTSVHTPKASIDDLITIADNIFKQIKEAKVDPNNSDESDALLERLQTEHANFTNSFPVVLRWMVQTRKYSNKAFKKYLMKHSTTKLDSKESFLRLQAEFIVLMFKEEHPRCPTKTVVQYRENIVNNLLEENKQFDEISKRVEEELKMAKDNANDARRQLIYKYLMENKIVN